MSRMLAIRRCLNVTQQELAAALCCTQTNVMFYERGQGLPRHRAELLIKYAATLGMALDFNQIYGDAPLPAQRQREAVQVG